MKDAAQVVEAAQIMITMSCGRLRDIVDGEYCSEKEIFNADNVLVAVSCHIET